MFSATNEKRHSKNAQVTEEQQTYLLELARHVIESSLAGFETTVEKLVTDRSMLKALSFDAATFVTLKKNGQLRGCIGTLIAHQSLLGDIVKNAKAASFNDHRFSPVTVKELDDIKIEISVLSQPEEIKFDSTQALYDVLQPNVDGIVIKSGLHSATFLPQVWSQLPDKDQFFSSLKRKAGLPDSFETTALEVYRYRVDHFSEYG